jgi:hypothetical protein
VHRPVGQLDPLGNGVGRHALPGGQDHLETPEHPGPRLFANQRPEFVRRVVWFDMHRGLLPTGKRPTLSSPQESRKGIGEAF